MEAVTIRYIIYIYYRYSEELKGDKRIVLAVVNRNRCALEYASDELTGDREVVLAAVSQSGCALEDASDE